MKTFAKAVAVLALLFSFKVYAQPTAIIIHGVAYQATYITNQAGSLVFLEQNGKTAGAGELHLSQKRELTGLITLGTNTYKVTLSDTNSSITSALTPPEPQAGDNDCLTSDVSQAKALIKKLALPKASLSQPVVVNIAVLFTPAAAAVEGGASNMLSEVQAAILEANSSYANSGIYVALNLVYTGPINYTEAVPGSLVSDLVALEQNTNAQAIRIQYGADVVSTMVKSADPVYAGMSGGYNGNPACGYNVVQAQYGVGYWVLAHEVGHNFGCDHDRANICYNAAFPYSYGFTFAKGGLTFGTVMSYPGIKCGLFSGPNTTYNGVLTGNTNNDNVDTVNQIAPIVATFHVAPPVYNLALGLNGTGTIAQDGVVNTSGTIPATATNRINLSANGNFVCWTGVTNTTQNRITLQLTQDTNLTANFADGSTYIPPVITQQPQSVSTAVGNLATLSVNGYGVPPPTCQWMFNGSPVATGNTLTFTSLAPDNQGAYQCVLSNAAGSTNSATVNITDQLSPVAQQPASICGLTNTPSSFTYQLNNPTGIAFQWYFNGNPIPNATNATYTIANTTLASAGNYYAVAACGNATEISSPATLTVNVPPSFRQQPTDVIATVGQDVAFTGVVAGSPNLAYQWQWNSNSIAGATNTTLTLHNVATTNNGSYRLRAKNPIATVYSANALLAAYVPLTITTQLANLNLPLGTAATMKAAVTGTSPTWQWFDNHGNLLPFTNSTCSLPNIQTNQAGTYTVIVTNLISAVTSTAAIYVLDPPVITQQPAPIIADAGTTASFAITTSGRGPQTFTWYQNGVAIPGHNNPTLNLANLAPNNVGAYYVNVANSDGMVNSYIANLALNDLPIIATQPQNTTVTNGANAGFFVGATGGQPLTYYWYQTNVLLSSGPSPSLVIPAATIANEGGYWVAVSNWLGGVASTTASLYVSTPPIITQQPVGAGLPAGQPLTLSVAAVGRPPMTYYWKLGSNVVFTAVDPNPNYTINNLQTNYNGAYTVLVSNADGTATSTKAVVAAIDTPWFTQQPSNNYVVAVNSNLTLTVKINPSAVAYQWYDNNGNAIPFCYTNSLILTNLQREQAGEYYVTATSFGGTTNSQNANVIVLDPPVWSQQPVGQSVFTNDTLSLTGVASTSEETINYQWFLGTNAIPGANGNNYSLTVADKTCVGTYKLMAWDNDATNYSKSVSVTWVKQPPVLTAPVPTPMIIAQGETLQIGLTLGGYPATGMQWFQNGVALPGQNGNPLYLSPFANNNAGNYTAVVTNEDGVLTAGPIVVTSKMVPPVIIAQPTSQIVAAGTPATFSVNCANQNNLSFQWLLNRMLLAGQNGQTLTIGSPTDADVGNYSVIVTDPYGSTASKTANLYVIDPPTILTQPKDDLMLALGGSGTLTVKALCSYGTNQFQWQFNGNNIPGATSGSYTINNANVNSQGTYQVLVYNAAGSVLSNPSLVTTTQGPIISQQPIGSTNQPGDSPSFTVTATGRGTLSYQWYYAGVPIPGETDSTLTLNSVELWQTNGFMVKIRNEDGSTSSATVYLTIEEAPTLLLQPSSQTLAYGQNLNLSCGATGPGGPLYYQWYFLPADANGVGIGITGATSANYSTNAKTAAFQGNYYVIVSNLLGSAQSGNATITMLKTPTITTQPLSQVTTLGRPAAIAVNAIGDQPMTFLWLHNGLVDPASSGNTLAIDSMTSSDLGSYSVCISNAVGGVISAAATLSAATNGLPPGIIAQPQNATVLSGKTATFTVIASGQAPLHYLWYDNGVPLPKQTGASVTTATINANNVGQDNYYVVVSNTNGAIASATVTTTLGSPATPPTIYSQPYIYPVVQYQTLDILMSVSPDAYSFMWYQNGTFYASTPTPELIVNNAGTSLAGKWTLVANNGLAKITSSNVVVSVTTLPAITVEPLPKSVAIGSNVTLSVTATGTGPLAYQWYDNNGNAIPWGLTNNLVITNAQPANEGTYWVSVINVNGEADSIPANLWVKQPPVITGQPMGAALNMDDTYTLSVTNTGHEPMTYLWFHNGNQLSDLSSRSLTLNGVQVIDAGGYSVWITNVDGGIMSSNAVLTVLGPPYITTVTASATVKAGTNYNLIASVGGTYTGLQWYLNGVGIGGANATNLTLTGITEANEGTYSLECSNSIGDLIQDVLILTVMDPPVIAQQPTAVSMQIGQPVTLSVTASGRVPMTYQWYLNTTLVDSGTALITGGNTATLTFTMATNLANKYQVTIGNADGAVTSVWATVTINTNADSSHARRQPVQTSSPADAQPTVYNGLFYEDGGIVWEHSGCVTVSVLERRFQGTLTIDDAAYPLAGVVTNNQGQAAIARSNDRPLAIVFELATNTIHGAVGDGTWTANLQGAAQTSSALAPAAYILWFNHLRVGTVSLTNATATLDAVLPGRELNQSCVLDDQGQWPVYLATALGWFQATATNVTGTLVWLTPGGTNELIHATSTVEESTPSQQGQTSEP